MKRYGRAFTTIFDPIIQAAFPLCFDGEGEGGPSVDEKMDAIFGAAPGQTGNPTEENPPAPDPTATADAEEKGTTEEANKAQPQPSEEEQPVEIDDDELMNELKGEESADAKLERITRERAASSKEAKRLGAENKALKSALEGQGLKIVVDKDGGVDFVPTEKYSGKTPVTELKLSDLPLEDVEDLESGDIDLIQSVFDKQLKKQAKSLTRALPTLEKEPIILSAEQCDSAFEHLSEMKDLDDTAKYPRMEKFRPHIEKQIEEKGLGDAFAQNPEYIASLVYGEIQRAYEAVVARKKAALKEAKAKENKGKTSSQTSVSSSSAPNAGGGGNDAVMDAVFGKA